MIRVFVADDHAVVRRGVLQILEEAPDMVAAGARILARIVRDFPDTYLATRARDLP